MVFALIWPSMPLSSSPSSMRSRLHSRKSSAVRASALCGMAESEEKTLQLPTDPYASYGVGDEVKVYLKASMGMKAVYLAYFLPLVVLLAVALGLIALGVKDYVAGLCGIGAGGLYYLVLYLVRERLQNEYVFTIASK